jgi:2'-hydroxyisoflavone reductase
MLKAPPGVFNVNSPKGSQTFGSLLTTAREVTGSDARFTWVDDEALLAAEVEPWTELPLWLPASIADVAWEVDVSAALQTGLAPRPLAESLADVWAWVEKHGLPSPDDAERPTEQEVRMGRERERQILAEFAGR